jgi:hypothetical protein
MMTIDIKNNLYMNKKIILYSTLILFGVEVHAQESFGGLNSGANSVGKNIYSVGEIFVVSSNADKNSSGTTGVFSTMILKSENGIIYIQEDEIKAFPNPTERTITIETKNLVLKDVGQIFHLNGKLIISKKLDKNELDLSNLLKGIYFLQISEKKLIKIEKK